MNYRSVRVAALTVLCCSVAAMPSQAQVVVTPNTSPPPLQNVQAFTIDASQGSHFDPHVDGTLISFTSNPDNFSGNHIRYFRLGLDTAPQEVPVPSADSDLLSKVSGTRIAYTHVVGLTAAINVFDTALPPGAGNPATVNPQTAAARFNGSFRGNLIAYIDATASFDASQQGDLVVYDLLTGTASRITNDTVADVNPTLSPDGATVVWEKCPVDFNHCDIWKAVNIGGTWVSSVVSDDPGNEIFPGTNGDVIVYAAERADGEHIFYRDAANVEHELVPPSSAGPGISAGPRIAGDFITFEGQTPSGRYNVFLFQLSTGRLWNLTNQSLFDDLLADVSVLPDGEVVVVYESTNPDAAHTSVNALRFTVPPVVPSYNVCPLYDATKAKKSGSTYPIQIRLCDASGANLSSPSIVVHAVGVTQLSTNAPGTLDDAGNSNPDFDFRYDATLAAYVFNLKTTGFATGTYSLAFTAGADPALHSALFQIK
jgi:Tol biopolymer transport system component